jgi:CRISPR system Cascade subunit CasB
MAEKHPFVEHLARLRADRGALAALRRGMGRPPGTVPEMYRFVVPWLPADLPAWREEAYYLIAALFAYHPAAGGNGNMGDHFARARAAQACETAVERRFSALLAAHRDDLPFCLQQAVGFLCSKDVAVDWNQLLSDVMAWGDPECRECVKRSWARAFWGRAETPHSQNLNGRHPNVC